MNGRREVHIALCLVAVSVVADVIRPRLPSTRAECRAVGGRCIPLSTHSQCRSGDNMCVGHCDDNEHTCLIHKDDRCEKLKKGKCVEATECARMADHGPCRFGCTEGRVCCMPDAFRMTRCWRNRQRIAGGRTYHGTAGGHGYHGHGRGMGGNRRRGTVGTRQGP